ncbi:reverse transcriptase domain-containing protein [Tanacetum coccineum]
MPRDCLRIIESKSKVRNSRNKPVVAKVSSSTSTPGVSSEVAELKDMVKALLLDKKKSISAPTPVKAVEKVCVTLRWAHSYQTCPATSGNVYQDNIQEYVSQAAAANFNQGNTGYRIPISNQIRPLVLLIQAPAYQALAHQTHGVSKTDFDSYIKANDAVMRNMQNQLTNLTDMLSKFVTSNTASTSGTLPSNTVTNPKEDLKGITTRSGVAYKGPTIHTTSSPKVVEREPEVTKDTMHPTNNGSTKDVPPPVVPIVHHESISEPVNAPVSASRPNQKASIPFPSRRNDERRREKANDQIEKFYEIFKDLSFEISFTDALMLMPKFASTLKTLIGNKEKLSEMARTPLNENCSAVILNKLPKKLGDPGRFLIPCEFSGINTCNALGHLGLADRSISEPIGIAEDVYVTVGKFQFPADFVVVDFEPDPRVPLILGRSFLKTSRALIDVYEAFEEYSQEVLGFSNVVSSGNPTPYYDLIVSTVSPTLTPFGDSDFLLFEEADSFLALEDDPTSPEPSHRLKLSDIKGTDPRFWYLQNSHGRDLTTNGSASKGGVKNPKIHDRHQEEVEKPSWTAGLILSNPLWTFHAHSYTDHSAIKYLFAKKDAKPRLMRWILLLQEFDVIIRDKKGAENLAADHLSRLENPHQDINQNKEITETFISSRELLDRSLHVDSSHHGFAEFP